jgi:hypothetical protein
MVKMFFIILAREHFKKYNIEAHRCLIYFYNKNDCFFLKI